MTGSEIAVIGLAARLPGARNEEEFWRNLRDGVESVKTLTDAEILSAGESPALLRDPAYVKAYASLDGVDQFDAGLFGFSPQDAALMDPQHRILLEVAWEALENSGYYSETFAGSIGVFAACSTNSYMMHQLLGNRRIMEEVGEWLVRHAGNDMNFLATRLSYKLNLTGPSMNVQTACSSALVAIHQAAQSLLSGECDMALAGGCVIQSLKPRGYLYRPGEILSPDGHCRPFDQNASGMFLSNGAGLVVLRRLADAEADGDPIRAVLLASAVNNDGSMKAGYLAPGVEGQAKVVSEALAAGGVHPESISYVEAHGTGTALGDPIEVAALSQAYRRHTRKKGFCALGSVKSNFGHLGEAAGVAGFIKTVLALEHRQIPPTLHFEKPNPQLDLANSPFTVSAETRDWPGSQRRAGVTALGAGGTNCHVILEEAPARVESGASRPYQLLTLSAATPAALDTAAANLAAYLEAHPEIPLADAAFTLNLGRKALAHRRAVVCANREEAAGALAGSRSAIAKASAPVAFLFPGQGSQYGGMARQLYEDEQVFREHVDRCAEILTPELGLDLRRAVFDQAADINQTALAQPALFTIETALAKLWISWGVAPRAMLGHSIGEYAAAHLAGVFTLEDALRLVAARGRLMQEMPAGAMLAVHLSAAQAERHMNGHAASGQLSLAALNAPELSVVAGSREHIAEFQSHLAGAGVTSQILHTSHAFHSPMLDPVMEPFRERVRAVELREPSLPFVSNLTGTWILPEQATDPEYWVQHLRKPVRFAAGVRTLLANPDQILLEVGPGRALSALVREQKSATVFPSLRRASENVSDTAFLLKTCGELWAHGASVDWTSFWKDQQRNRVALPAYPFQHQTYWIEPDSHQTKVAEAEPVQTGRREGIENWFDAPVWQPAAIPPPAQNPRRRWLVFADEAGLSEELTRRLAGPGIEIVTVRAGSEFRRIAENEFVLRPDQERDYRALFEAQGEAASGIDAVAHLWGVATRSTAWTENFNRLYLSLTRLAKTFGRLRSGEADWFVISNRLQDIAGETELDPAKAILLGPCRVIPREFEGIRCRSIDVPAQVEESQSRARIADQLAAELQSNSSDRTVAYRGSQRWTQRFEQVRLIGGNDAALRERGVYLITGGLGGPGLELAGYLARTAKARLILLGRKAPDAVGLKKIKDLEAAGAEVMVAAADVTQLKEMRKVIEGARAAFGPIHGVFHAARSLDDQLIQIQDAAAAEAVFLPKVQGALVLEEIFAGAKLDFLVLFSSISPALGIEGQSAYAAANAFLNSLARRLNSTGRQRAIAVGWGPWDEPGTAARSAAHHPPDARMLPQDALTALSAILGAHSPAHVFVTPVSIEEWLRHTDSSARPAAARKEEGGAGGGSIEQRLRSMWSQLLGIEEIGINDDFFELGGHSLLLVRLAARIEKAFHKDLPMPFLMESPTIAKIAAGLREEGPAETSTIVPLQEHRSGPAFFCVHPLGGEVLPYRPLRRYLDAELNFCGIQLPREWRAPGAMPTVEVMAERYVRDLLRFQPEGPYILGGWSAGSPVALEMAQQLTAQGHEVRLLVCMDGALFNTGAELSRWNPVYSWRLLRNVPRWIADALSEQNVCRDVWSRAILKAQGAMKKLRARLRGDSEIAKYEVRGFMGAEFDDEQIAAMEAFFLALQRYTPRPYAGEVLLYVAQTQPLHHLFDTPGVWKAIASSLEIVPSKGSHGTMLEEPRVRSLAAHLNPRLRDAVRR